MATSLGRGYDQIMDRYTHVLSQLQADDYRRLRSYANGSSAKFEIWLVAVARRLCVDHHRSSYGRTDRDHASSTSQAARRNLADLIVQDIDTTPVPTDPTLSPESALRLEERRALVHEELARLPTSDRLMLRLRFEDEVPVKDIAAALGFPSVFHVYRRLKSVLAQLKGRLTARGVTDPEP